MNELIDVLNEEGIFHGVSKPRAEVHNKGLWHRTVHVYVYQGVAENIQILVHLRSANKDLYPNTWDPVLGGHVSAGRTPMQTVIDELSGEVGLSVARNMLAVGPIIKTDKGLDKEFNHIFAYLFPRSTQIRFNDNEVQMVRWMDTDEITRSIQTASSEWRPTEAEWTAERSAITTLLKR